MINGNGNGSGSWISVQIPAGETVYYRMKCETAGATLECSFRYYYR